jgi:hypothetical protein
VEVKWGVGEKGSSSFLRQDQYDSEVLPD